MKKEIKELINKKIISIDNMNNEELIFELDNGDKYKMYHCQDCCEDVRIEDIIGDLNCLLNNVLTMAEEVTESGEAEYGSYTWTFYKFATVKGYVTVRWYGESNGYYSEEVDIVKIN